MRVKKLKRVLEQQEAEEDMVESSWVGLVFSAVGWCVLEIFVWEVRWFRWGLVAARGRFYLPY